MERAGAVHQFSPDDVVTSLLAFLPPVFNNDPEKIHRTIKRLQQKKKYKELLGGFDFLDQARFPYSPLLARVLNRLQESRLLSSRNPDYVVYEVKPESQAAIRSYFLDRGRVLSDYSETLNEIAKELNKELTNIGAAK